MERSTGDGAGAPGTKADDGRRSAGGSAAARRGVWAEHDSLRTILELVRSGVGDTRLELERSSGLGRAVVAHRVATLVARGLLEEGEAGSSTGGRAPRTLRFRSEAAVLGVAYASATSLGVALADLSGELLIEHHESGGVAAGPEAIVERLSTLIDWVMTEHRGDRPLWGIGLSLPAPVERLDDTPFGPQVVRGLPGWEANPVRSVLARRYRVPVWMDSGTHLMAEGERRAGRGEGSPDLLFLKIGTRISAGFSSGGKLHRGAQGAAGFIAHFPTGEAARVVCSCGSSSCLEVTASGAAIGRSGMEAALSGASPALAEDLERQKSVSAADVSLAAARGDRAASEILVRAGRLIGATLAALVDFYNPSLVVVGGGVTQAGDVLLASIREAAYGRSLPLATRELRILRASLGRTASLVGAAVLVADELFGEQILGTWIDEGSPTESAAVAAAVHRIATEMPEVIMLPPDAQLAAPVPPARGLAEPGARSASSAGRRAGSS